MAKIRKGHAGKSRAADGWLLRLVVITAMLIGLIVLGFLYLPSMLDSSAGNHESSYSNNETYSHEENDMNDLLPTGSTNPVIHHEHYSLAYNEAKEQADWVMYSLTKSSLDAKNVPRAKRFKDDPKVRTKSAFHNDYSHSGFTRGHLAPAGDMAFSSNAMRECFYMSNMSPQPRKFNNGIWKELEELVRDWALDKDELLIITGPIFTSKEPEVIGKNRVAVPDEFYKVIVDRDNKKNIAFRMPNDLSTKHLKDYVVSINDLEASLGFDFLPGFLDETQEDNNSPKGWSFSDRKFKARVNSWNKQ